MKCVCQDVCHCVITALCEQVISLFVDRVQIVLGKFTDESWFPLNLEKIFTCIDIYRISKSSKLYYYLIFLCNVAMEMRGTGLLDFDSCIWKVLFVTSHSS